jgi:AraC-like DNA-binding protein
VNIFALNDPAPSPDAYGGAALSVAALARDYPNGWLVGPHCHEHGQFIHATSGVMEIRAGRGLWLAPPGRAIWMPPRAVHELRARGAVSLRTLYIAPQAAPAGFGDEPKGYAVTPLLRELIVRAIDYEGGGAEESRRRLIAVLLDELGRIPACELSIRMPQDARLERACASILSDLSASRTIGDLAADCGASPRTLARLANDELGCPLSVWRQQARILEAVPMLVAGEPVTQTALALGYETPSAFAAMFRRILGVTPSAFTAD